MLCIIMIKDMRRIFKPLAICILHRYWEQPASIAQNFLSLAREKSNYLNSIDLKIHRNIREIVTWWFQIVQAIQRIINMDLSWSTLKNEWINAKYRQKFTFAMFLFWALAVSSARRVSCWMAVARNP